MQGFTVNEEDKKAFLDDFKNADVNQKLDMWYYALEQDAIWEEIIAEVADIAQMDQMKKAGIKKVASKEEQRYMNEDDKKEFVEAFKKADGATRLDMWDYAIGQQVLWENIIGDLQKIAHDQGVDKKLEKMMEEDLKES